MFANSSDLATVFLTVLLIGLGGCITAPVPQEVGGTQVLPDLVSEPYDLDTGLVSRSISFESPTGAAGEGGKAASGLGVGRKGAPMRRIQPGEMVTLCDIDGPGTIRHIWMTTRRNPVNLRSLVIRAYWDGQEHPSIECPVGDFMGFAHGRVEAYHSAAHSVGEHAGMNIWLPMPFTTNARITFTNEGENTIPLYYQIDYTVGNRHKNDVGRLHTLFRRENPTTLKEDFTILPQRRGKGRYIGAILGIRYEDSRWWGEGEIKIYMDGDNDFPTICGTGSEDYVCLSYGMQQTPFLFNGCSLNDTQNQYVSMYRWHLPDPIYWKDECRITIQQIGWSREKARETGSGLYERQDDWSTATFWYEPVPSEPLSDMPDVAARIADLKLDVN
ncbi:MAG: glycoside hydrolase family 172 protein [Acidobacteriota bacterium]